MVKSIEVIGSIVAPAAFITGLLYYFGWVRTGALFAYFGVEQTMLGYTTNDYLLRSAGVAFRPAASLLVIGVGALIFYRVLAAIFGRHDILGIVLLATTGILSCALFITSMRTLFGLSSIGGPLFSAVGLIVSGLAVESAASIGLPGAKSRSATFIRRTLVIGVIIVGSFWACAIYAQNTGSRLGSAWGSNLQLRPAVTVYSHEDLHLTGSGIVATRLSSETGYRYHYSGMHLLVYSHEHWFLLPQGWRRGGKDTAIILVDGGTIRVEVAPGS